jgi:hypothetical protein
MERQLSPNTIGSNGQPQLDTVFFPFYSATLIPMYIFLLSHQPYIRSALFASLRKVPCFQCLLTVTFSTRNRCQWNPAMATLRRPKKYRELLTPLLHRRFVSSSTVLVTICLGIAALAGGSPCELRSQRSPRECY